MVAPEEPLESQRRPLGEMGALGRALRAGTFKKFGRMLRGHLDGILSWTKSRVSNRAVEGMNNKIKPISHRSFGFRTAENFIAAIYHCCTRLPLPVERQLHSWGRNRRIDDQRRQDIEKADVRFAYYVRFTPLTVISPRKWQQSQPRTFGSSTASFWRRSLCGSSTRQSKSTTRHWKVPKRRVGLAFGLLLANTRDLLFGRRQLLH